MNSPVFPLRQLLLLSLGTVGTFFFFFKAYTNIPQLIGIINNATGAILVWAIIAVLPTPLLSATRWYAVLRASGYIFPFTKIVRITMASMAFIAVPGRLGDFVRCYPLRHEARIAKLAATIVAEKIIDVAVLCILSALGFLLISHPSPASGMFLLGISALSSPILLRVLPITIRPKGPIEKLGAAAEVFREGMRQPAWISVGIFASTLNWITSLVSIWLLFGALGERVPLHAVFAYVPLAIFSGLIPFGLAGTGTRDAAFLMFFSAYAPATVILATSIGYSVLGYLLLTIIGLPFLNNLKPFPGRIPDSTQK